MSIAALIGCGLVAASSPAYAQREGGPFAGLAGSWAGNGSVTLSNGSSERIRCRAGYEVAPSGNSLRQNLKCASDSYNFDLNSEVVYQGGSISGTWRETTKRATGGVSGTASPGAIQARVDGPSFQANLALTTRGDRQNISIRSAGTELSGATISLSRGR
jgi:hypothetical protein